MCGRYASSGSVEEIVEEFDVDLVVGEVPPPRWNIAPTQEVVAVVERLDGDGSVRKLVTPRWGLVPSWAKDPKSAARLINARVETVAEKPSFRKALAARRCLIPADGYYEWYVTAATRAGKPAKQPFYIHPRDERFLAMAGLYEFWKTPEGDWLTTCTVITTSASDELGHLHDRMPMTVLREDRDAWLSPSLTSSVETLALLTAPAGMAAYAVSPRVGNVAHDDPTLVEPLPLAE